MAPRRGYSEVLKHRGFVYLLLAQALAVFDDNTFKQLVLLFVTARVISLATRNLVISLGTALYVLPYIVFSTYAGQVADRFSKRRVIIFIKILEASLLVLATIAMAVGQVTALLAVLFLLGIHACFLDPAKEGILPQIFPDEDQSHFRSFFHFVQAVGFRDHATSFASEIALKSILAVRSELELSFESRSIQAQCLSSGLTTAPRAVGVIVTSCSASFTCSA